VPRCTDFVGRRLRLGFPFSRVAWLGGAALEGSAGLLGVAF